ncbi:Hsp20/alpha crystallin family protein [Halorientalis marina]|jgi:HSP20 family molecular chaperone IbpA|uniref:Hsp20/alpha crystallin family protein n=1 Tax=Halorientalis marina TaxID=2931976 RepID=UPI001FF43C57|nr:Hsp20/alpha crystallin family protein [Halorientalis marina]
MIRELGRTLTDTVMETVGRAASRVQERRPLPVDLLESDEAYLAVFDAPGATSSDVQVRFDENRVEVRLDRFRDFYDGFEMRLPGRGLSLDGHVTLPPDAKVDAREAAATLKRNGTLHVRVPKTEDATASVGEETVETDVESDDADDHEADETEAEDAHDDSEADDGTDETDDE